MRLISRLPARLLIFAVLSLSAGMLLSAQATGPAPTTEIPVVPRLTFVLAVHNPNAAPPGSNIAMGDYEMVVSVDDVTADALTLSTRIEAENERQQKLDLKIERRLASADL